MSCSHESKKSGIVKDRYQTETETTYDIDNVPKPGADLIYSRRVALVRIKWRPTVTHQDISGPAGLDA